MHDHDCELARVRTRLLKTDNLLDSSQERTQQMNPKNQVRGRAFFREQSIYGLHLRFASGTLFFPAMEILRMTDRPFYNRGKVEKTGLGDVFVVGKIDQVARQRDIG